MGPTGDGGVQPNSSLFDKACVLAQILCGNGTVHLPLLPALEPYRRTLEVLQHIYSSFAVPLGAGAALHHYFRQWRGDTARISFAVFHIIRVMESRPDYLELAEDPHALLAETEFEVIPLLEKHLTQREGRRVMETLRGKVWRGHLENLKKRNLAQLGGREQISLKRRRLSSNYRLGSSQARRNDDDNRVSGESTHRGNSTAPIIMPHRRSITALTTQTHCGNVAEPPARPRRESTTMLPRMECRESIPGAFPVDRHDGTIGRPVTRERTLAEILEDENRETIEIEDDTEEMTPGETVMDEMASDEETADQIESNSEVDLPEQPHSTPVERRGNTTNIPGSFPINRRGSHTRPATVEPTPVQIHIDQQPTATAPLSTGVHKLLPNNIYDPNRDDLLHGSTAPGSQLRKKNSIRPYMRPKNGGWGFIYDDEVEDEEQPSPATKKKGGFGFDYDNYSPESSSSSSSSSSEDGGQGGSAPIVKPREKAQQQSSSSAPITSNRTSSRSALSGTWSRDGARTKVATSRRTKTRGRPLSPSGEYISPSTGKVLRRTGRPPAQATVESEEEEETMNTPTIADTAGFNKSIFSCGGVTKPSHLNTHLMTPSAKPGSHNAARRTNIFSRAEKAQIRRPSSAEEYFMSGGLPSPDPDDMIPNDQDEIMQRAIADSLVVNQQDDYSTFRATQIAQLQGLTGEEIQAKLDANQVQTDAAFADLLGTGSHSAANSLLSLHTSNSPVNNARKEPEEKTGNSLRRTSRSTFPLVSSSSSMITVVRSSATPKTPKARRSAAVSRCENARGTVKTRGRPPKTPKSSKPVVVEKGFPKTPKSSKLVGIKKGFTQVRKLAVTPIGRSKGSLENTPSRRSTRITRFRGHFSA